MESTFNELVNAFLGNAGIEILLTLFIAVAINWIIKRVLTRLDSKLSNNNRVWTRAILRSLTSPLHLFVWLVAINVITTIISSKFSLRSAIYEQITLVFTLLFIATFLWFLLRMINNVELGMLHSDRKFKHIRDKTSVRAIAQLLRVVAIVIVILIAMQSSGIHIGTLLAVGGIGGIAIGFAAKDTLANFLGGMMIYWDRPFSVGDWVRSPDRDIEGTVENIGWRLTRIRTFDKRPLYVPNGVFSTISIENPSRMTNRRIKTSIGVRYSDATKIRQISEDVQDMLRNHAEIDSNLTLFVYLYEFGPSSLNMLVYTFTKTTDWVKFQAIQQDVFLRIIDIISSHGAQCAFPTRTLDFADSSIIAHIGEPKHD